MDPISSFVFDICLALIIFSVGYFGGAFLLSRHNAQKYSDQSDGSHAHEDLI